MVSGQWSGRTTMLSSLCVETGVVSDQFQFANELHDESESTLRQAWLGTLDFEKSTLRQLNWSWLHPTLEKARILRLKKYSIAVAWSPTTMKTASIEKATTLWCNPGKKFLSNTSGAVPRDDMYHEKFNPVKRGPNDNPEHPRHHIKVRIFPIIFTKRCHTLELFSQANQGWRNKMSRSKDSKFWTLADR